MCSDAGQEETVTEVVTLKKDHQRLAPLGLTLAGTLNVKTVRHDACVEEMPDTAHPQHLHALHDNPMAAVLVQWHGLQSNMYGFVPLSIAEFSL